ncbi:MAG: NADH-ubiquinone oxidoreductase-F iron-sulfur binding region domain-containing protein [Nitriliruptor sp.]
MTRDTDRLLPPNPVRTLDDHLAAGGGAGLERALELTPEEVTELVDQAGLRGRGGAGFPTARKWRGVVANAEAAGVAPTLIANGAEGEPGTYKDRVLLEQQPFVFLEGVCIALHATGASAAHVATKEKFTEPVAALTDALAQIQAARWPGADRIEVTLGPDAYLFGEETGMLAVIEGDLPLPRVTRPYEEGLGGSSVRPNPSAVNNVETLSHLPRIVADGPDWFREAGTESSPGTMLFTVVGDVDSPGTYELALGTSLRTLLEDIAGARDIKVVAPGVSSALITPDMLDLPLDFDAMREAGTGLGSGGYVVYDSSRSIVDVLATLIHFLAIESCGQCNACKLGNGEMDAILSAMQRGEATQTDLERLLIRSHTVTDQNRCYLPVGSQALVGSAVEAFVEEFTETVAAGRPTPGDLPVPLIDHIDEATGTVTYHERYHLKRADWSYEGTDPGAERLAALRGQDLPPG